MSLGQPRALGKLSPLESHPIIVGVVLARASMVHGAFALGPGLGKEVGICDLVAPFHGLWGPSTLVVLTLPHLGHGCA